MKTNESVISWLNKQLTNAKIRDPSFRIAPPPKNLSNAMCDISGQTMATMQPSMATEQRNNKLVASTPIQYQDSYTPITAKGGKENRLDDKSAEKSDLDPKYLQPSKSKTALKTTIPSENGAKRKSIPTATKQQSVYFN